MIPPALLPSVLQSLPPLLLSVPVSLRCSSHHQSPCVRTPFQAPLPQMHFHHLSTRSKPSALLRCLHHWLPAAIHGILAGTLHGPVLCSLRLAFEHHVSHRTFQPFGHPPSVLFACYFHFSQPVTATCVLSRHDSLLLRHRRALLAVPFAIGFAAPFTVLRRCYVARLPCCALG